MHPLKMWKENQKDLAKQIREMKSKRKDSLYGHVAGLDCSRWEYRHNHIAYCELRGRTRIQIEKCAPDNKPDEDRITMLKDAWIDSIALHNLITEEKEMQSEVICPC